MTPEQFAYWLQGYTELTAGQQPTPEQWQSITEHLKTVFVKVTPSVQKSPPTPAEDPSAAKRFEDAMRRINEERQRQPWPYSPGQNSPNWGSPYQAVC